MKVCQTYEGMSNFWRYVKLMKVYYNYEGMLNLWRYVKLMKVCQTYEGMSNLIRYVKFMKVSQTYEGVSNLWRYVTFTKACQAYGVSRLWGYVTIMWDIFLAFQPLWHFRPSELIRKRRPLSWLFVYFSIGFLVINDSDPRQRKRWCVWLQFPFGSRGVFGFWISKYYCSRKSSWARIEWKSNLGGFDI